MKRELDYLRRRFTQEMEMAAAATHSVAKNAHYALADASDAKIIRLRSEANEALLELLDQGEH